MSFNANDYADRSRAIPYDPANTDAYRRAKNQVEEEFRAAMEAEHGVEGYPREVRDALYSQSWSLGHSAGLSEVAIYYSDLVDLVKVSFEAGQKTPR